MKKITRTKTTCPISRVTELVGDHSTLLIVRDLLVSPRRFKDLQDSLGISTRTLCNKLKSLEQADMITRQEFSEKPPRVEYSLTPKGRGLASITEAMKQYGEKYL